MNVSRALGDGRLKKCEKLGEEEQAIIAKPEIVKVKSSTIDYIFMGCDGLFETRSNVNIIDWLNQRRGRQAEEVLTELFESLVAQSSEAHFGMDNMSAILISFQK